MPLDLQNSTNLVDGPVSKKKKKTHQSLCFAIQAENDRHEG